MEHQWTKISSRIWLDERVLALDPEGFKLFVYVMTNQDRMDTGLSRFSVGLASDITGIDYDKCKGLVEGFCKPLPDGFGWTYHKPSNTLLIPTWLDDKKLDSKNTLDGIMKTLSLVPATPLVVDWFRALCERLDGETLKGSKVKPLACTPKNLLSEVEKHLSKTNFKTLTEGLGIDLAKGLTEDLGVRTKNQEPSTKNQDSLEDHNCKGGDARGGAAEAEPQNTEYRTSNVEVYADPETWSDELIARVELMGKKQFKGFKVSQEDRITLYRLAALVVGGVTSEAWLADAVAATKAAIAKGSIQKTHTSYLYGCLGESCKKCGLPDIKRLIAPVRLPEKLKRAPPRKG